MIEIPRDLRVEEWHPNYRELRSNFLGNLETVSDQMDQLRLYGESDENSVLLIDVADHADKLQHVFDKSSTLVNKLVVYLESSVNDLVKSIKAKTVKL